MKLCNSPANTTCMYQRLARDQAPADPDEPDNNGAASQAYADLYQRLEASNDTEALALLKHLMNCLTDGGAAMDEPPPFRGRPRPGGTMTAMDRALRSGRAQAQQYVFAKRFPGAARIRVLG